MPSAVVVGASSGIGRAVSSRLLDEGYEVLGVARRPSAIEHDRYQHLVADAGGESFRTALADSLVATPDLCLYAAGVGDTVDYTSMGGELETVRTNLLGLVATAEVVVPLMVAAGAGHLIGLSSQADRQIDGRAPSYAASKAGMSSYLEGLALGLRKHGVGVTNVRLGFVDTAMAKSPIKPFMMSAEAAATIVLDSREGRPIRVTRPRRMAVLLSVIGAPARWQARLR